MPTGQELKGHMEIERYKSPASKWVRERGRDDAISK